MSPAFLQRHISLQDLGHLKTTLKDDGMLLESTGTDSRAVQLRNSMQAVPVGRGCSSQLPRVCQPELPIECPNHLGSMPSDGS